MLSRSGLQGVVRPGWNILRALGVSGLCLVLGAATASAQDSPLPFISADADIVIRLREPDLAVEEVADLVTKVQSNAGQLVQGQAGQIGRLISNPELTGVDRSRPWYVAAFNQGREEPTVVFAIPAVSAADLVGALPEGTKSEVHDRWVLYTEAEKLPAVEAGKSLAAAWNAPLLSAMEGGDLTVYINAEHLSRAFVAELDALHKQVLDGLSALRFLPQQDQAVNLQPLIEMYGAGADGIFQAIKDCRYATLSLNLQDGNVAIDKSITFLPETESARQLAANPSKAISLLGKLPANLDMYLGGAMFSKELTAFSLDLSTDMIQDAAQKEQFRKNLEEIKQFDYQEMAIGAKFQAGEGGLFNGYSLMQVSPWEKYRDVSRNMQMQMKSVEFGGVKQVTELQVDAETVGDHKVDVSRIQMEYSGDSVETQMQRKAQEMMFGDGIQSRSTFVSGINAITMNGGAEAMRALLSGLDAARTRPAPAHVPPMMEKANVVGHFDLARISVLSVLAASREGLIPIKVSEQSVDGLNLPRSYIGFAIGSEGNTLHAQLRVPVGQIQGFTRIGVLFAAIGSSL